MYARSHILTALIVLRACSATVCWAQTPATTATTKAQDIHKLMQLTGATDLGIQTLNQMIHTFKQSEPRVPESYWEEFRGQVDTGEMLNLLIPIYDKHLSQSDIREAIRFYQTPAGHRLAKALPLITQEAMLVGGAWGEQIGQRAAAKLTPSPSPLSQRSYTLSSSQVQRVGEIVGKIATAEAISNFFGLYACVEGYTGGVLSRTQAMALVKQFRTDAATTLRELRTLFAALGEGVGDQDSYPPLENCLRSLLKQADFFTAHATDGDIQSLDNYRAEHKRFVTLMRAL